jgi:hypothetical protein
MKKIKSLITAFFMGIKKIEDKITSNNDSDVLYREDINANRLSDALLRGELTEEVKKLRWRIYKILSYYDEKDFVIKGYDENDIPIIEAKKKTVNIKKLNIYKDDNDIEMIIKNVNYYSGVSDASGNEKLDLIGMENETKSNTKIEIEYNSLPKFNLEEYIEKMVVKKKGESYINELYVNKYEKCEYRRRDKLFLSEIKKIKDNNFKSSITDIKKIKFISDFSDLKVKLLHEFEFDIIKLIDVIEYDYWYIIRLESKEGEIFNRAIYEDYINKELEEKYKLKARKK